MSPVSRVNAHASESAQLSDTERMGRLETLVAEYLRAWGLREPQSIATLSRNAVEHCVAAADSAASLSFCDLARRAVVHAAAELDAWLDALAAKLGVPANELAGRRGLLAFEFRSIIERRPAVLLAHPMETSDLVENDHGRTNAVVPPPLPRPMPEQPLDDLPAMARRTQIARVIEGMSSATRRLASLSWPG